MDATNTNKNTIQTTNVKSIDQLNCEVSQAYDAKAVGIIQHKDSLEETDSPMIGDNISPHPLSQGSRSGTGSRPTHTKTASQSIGEGELSTSICTYMQNK